MTFDPVEFFKSLSDAEKRSISIRRATEMGMTEYFRRENERERLRVKRDFAILFGQFIIGVSLIPLIVSIQLKHYWFTGGIAVFIGFVLGMTICKIRRINAEIRSLK